MENTQRTHDKFYLHEDRSRQPKEYFKFVAELTKQRLNGKSDGAAMVDVGCASGDFLYYLGQCFPGAKLHGIDVSQELVEASRGKLPGITLRSDDIASPTFKDTQFYDVVFMLGVHSIFNECDLWVKNIARLMKKEGIGLVFGLFNPHPFDVLVKVRKAGESGKFEAGWNSMSQATVASEFKKHKRNVEFIPWHMPLDIPFNAADPLRSWTTQLADGRNLVTNATRVIHDFHCAVIS